jgi:protein-disulfide isomerase/uncharacterized membrane protein
MNIKNELPVHKVKSLAQWFLVVSVIGWAISAYSAWHRQTLLTFGAQGSFCSISKTIDCDSVALSKYAEIFGYSTAGWGMVFYGVISVLILSLFFNLSDGKFELGARKANFLFRLVGLGLIPSLVLAVVSFFVLKKLCIMCVALYVCIIGLFLIIQKMHSLLKPSGDGTWYDNGIIISLGVVGAINFSVTPILSASFLTEMRLSKPILQAIENNFSNAQVRTFQVANAPTLGPKDAPVTIVEFSDYQCHFCSISSKTLPPLVESFGGKVKLVYKSFPLDSTCNKNTPGGRNTLSCFGAKVGLCLFKEKGDEIFFEYKKAIFGNQKSLNRAFIENTAVELGLPKERLSTCVEDIAINQDLLAQIEEAVVSGVDGTPAIFINGKRLPSGPTPFILKILINKELEKN